jgi:succinate dehydrogenase / fumarate reductase flavoprotein subunit
MREAAERLQGFRRRASAVSVAGHREYHAGWHTAIDLQNLLDVSEAIALAALERRESRGGHFREDYPDKTAEFGKINIVIKRGSNGEMQVSRVPIPEMPPELKQIIEEQKQ